MFWVCSFIAPLLLLAIVSTASLLNCLNDGDKSSQKKKQTNRADFKPAIDKLSHGKVAGRKSLLLNPNGMGFDENVKVEKSERVSLHGEDLAAKSSMDPEVTQGDTKHTAHATDITQMPTDNNVHPASNLVSCVEFSDLLRKNSNPKLQSTQQKSSEKPSTEKPPSNEVKKTTVSFEPQAQPSTEKPPVVKNESKKSQVIEKTPVSTSKEVTSTTTKTNKTTTSTTTQDKTSTLAATNKMKKAKRKSASNTYTQEMITQQSSGAG